MYCLRSGTGAYRVMLCVMCQALSWFQLLGSAKSVSFCNSLDRRGPCLVFPLFASSIRNDAPAPSAFPPLHREARDECKNLAAAFVLPFLPRAIRWVSMHAFIGPSLKGRIRTGSQKLFDQNGGLEWCVHARVVKLDRGAPFCVGQH